MTAGGWALVGFCLMALGEAVREAEAKHTWLTVVFMLAFASLAVAVGKHVGALP